MDLSSILNPSYQRDFISEALGQPSLSSEVSMGQVNPSPSLSQMFGVSQPDSSIPVPQPNTQGTAMQGITNDNSPLYLENVPVPLSNNNPYMAMFPKKGSGLSATRRLISKAIEWENQESIRKDSINRPIEAAELEKRRMGDIALKVLQDAYSNQNIAGKNSDKLNIYKSILSNPGGEQFAPDIINNILGMTGQGSSGLTAIDQAKLGEIEANTRYKNRQTSLLGLKEGSEQPFVSLKEFNQQYYVPYLQKQGLQVKQDSAGNINAILDSSGKPNKTKILSPEQLLQRLTTPEFTQKTVASWLDPSGIGNLAEVPPDLSQSGRILINKIPANEGFSKAEFFQADEMISDNKSFVKAYQAAVQSKNLALVRALRWRYNKLNKTNYNEKELYYVIAKTGGNNG